MAPSRGAGAATQRVVIGYAREAEAEVDLIEACARAGQRPGDAYPYAASPAARQSLTLFGQQLAEVRREHVAGAPTAKTVIATLTIAGGPVDYCDQLLQSTDDADVAADCARVKEACDRCAGRLTATTTSTGTRQRCSVSSRRRAWNRPAC